MRFPSNPYANQSKYPQNPNYNNNNMKFPQNLSNNVNQNNPYPYF